MRFLLKIGGEISKPSWLKYSYFICLLLHDPWSGRQSKFYNEYSKENETCIKKSAIFFISSRENKKSDQRFKVKIIKKFKEDLIAAE